MYKLIIVDDEEKTRDFLVHLFPWGNLGFTIAASFADGKKAYDYIIGNPVDAVFTDIEMPGCNGLELAEKIKKAELDIPVVILSAHSNFQYARKAIDCGVCAYVLKPVEYGELMSCFTQVKERLDRRRGVAGALPDAMKSGYYDQIIQKVDRYLSEHYATATLTSTAEFCQFSPTYLSRLFKEKADINFSDYLNEKKMQVAGKLLRDSANKIYEVACKVGYDNPKNFTRAFRLYYGISPREFRESPESTLHPAGRNTLHEVSLTEKENNN